MPIPTNLTEEEFNKFIEPYLSKAKRGFISKIPLYKIFNYILYFLHTGCQWSRLPIENSKENNQNKEISYQAVYYHFRKWSRDGSFENLFKQSILFIKEELNLSEITFDGTHSIAKKGGQLVKYQARKKAKTSNILPITEKNGYILATSEIFSGNHHDSFELEKKLKTIFKDIKSLGLNIEGSHFNADCAFDTTKSRKIIWNNKVIPNIYQNIRNQQNTKRGRRKYFNKAVYKNRFTIERSFAWVDKFKRLVVRYERKAVFFLSLNFIAFTMINLRNIIH